MSKTIPYRIEHDGHTVAIQYTNPPRPVYTARQDTMVPKYTGIIEGKFMDVHGDTLDEVEQRARFLIDHSKGRTV